MRYLDGFRNFKQALLAAGFGLMLGAAAQSAVIVSEVAPWSSSSTLGADWFELTNTGVSSVGISGWAVDDSSNSFATALTLNGITNIAAGESVIFIESADPAGIASAFKTLWYGASPPASLQIGTYTGGGIGLSGSGDAVNIFNGSGVAQAGVMFGAADATPPLQTFDNAAGASTVTLLSQVSINGAFVAAGDATQIASPGTIVSVPEPASAMLLVLAAGTVLGLNGARRRRVRS